LAVRRCGQQRHDDDDDDDDNDDDDDVRSITFLFYL